MAETSIILQKLLKISFIFWLSDNLRLCSMVQTRKNCLNHPKCTDNGKAYSFSWTWTMLKRTKFRNRPRLKSCAPAYLYTPHTIIWTQIAIYQHHYPLHIEYSFSRLVVGQYYGAFSFSFFLIVRTQFSYP